MEKVASSRFLIEGFPMNFYQLKQFESTFGAPTKLFYLALYKEELIIRCKRPEINVDYADYLNKAGALIDYAEKKPYFSRINVNFSIENSLDQIAKVIEPEVVMVINDVYDNVKHFLEEKGYQYINLHKAMESVCSRKTEKGKEIIRLTEAGKIVSGRLLISIIQDFIYSGSTFGKKFVLGGSYPAKVKELEFIEKNCVKVQRLYYFVEYVDNSIVHYLEEANLVTYMFNQGRFVKLTHGQPFEIELEQRVDRVFGKYILIIGAVLSGKTTLAKKFAEKHGFKLINYGELPEIIKAKKSTEDEPYEKVSFLDILQEIKSYISDPYDTIVLDGIPNQSLVLPEIEALNDEDEEKDRSDEYLNEVYNKFIEVLGIPYLTLHLSTDLKNIKPRLFKRLELGPEDELNDDQIEPIKKSIDFDNKLAGVFSKHNQKRSLTSVQKQKYYDVNTNLSEDRSFAYISSIFSAKIVLIEDTLQKEILTVISNVCINKDLVHLNIPKVLLTESEKKTERGLIVANLLKQKVSIPTSLIISILKEYIKKLLTGDQIVILSQFLDNKDPYEYPRTMDEFIAIEEHLGEIVGVIVVTPKFKKRQVEIENIPVVHYPPPKKEEEAKQEEDEEGEIVQKIEDDPLPPRSEPRKPVNLPKMFQVYKRNVPKFQNWDSERTLEEAVNQVFLYVANEQFLSANDQERLGCPNIQILN